MTMVFAWMCVDVTKDDRAVHSHILDFPFFGIIMLHLRIFYPVSGICHQLSKKKN